MLAEGSKLVMVALQSAYSQGVYGLVTNLGSLVVRMLFQARVLLLFRLQGPSCCPKCPCMQPRKLYNDVEHEHACDGPSADEVVVFSWHVA